VEPSWTGAAEAADEILDWTAEKLSQAWEAVKSWIDRNAKAIVGGPVGMVIGAALVGGLYSGVVSAQERLGKGQSWSQVFWGSLADATGVGQIHSAITDQDIATGERLGLSQTQKMLNLAFGSLQLFGTVAGIAKVGMAAVRGMRGTAGVRRATPAVSIDEMVGMAKRQDCVTRAIEFDAIRTGRTVPTGIQAPGKMADILRYSGRVRPVRAGNVDELVEQLSKYSDDIGGIVVGHRGHGELAHAFNWYTEKGKLVFVDPEIGLINDVAKFAKDQGFSKLSWVSTPRVF